MIRARGCPLSCARRRIASLESAVAGCSSGCAVVAMAAAGCVPDDHLPLPFPSVDAQTSFSPDPPAHSQPVFSRPFSHHAPLAPPQCAAVARSSSSPAPLPRRPLSVAPSSSRRARPVLQCAVSSLSYRSSLPNTRYRDAGRISPWPCLHLRRFVETTESYVTVVVVGSP